MEKRNDYVRAILQDVGRKLGGLRKDPTAANISRLSSCSWGPQEKAGAVGLDPQVLYLIGILEAVKFDQFWKPWV